VLISLPVAEDRRYYEANITILTPLGNDLVNGQILLVQTTIPIPRSHPFTHIRALIIRIPEIGGRKMQAEPYPPKFCLGGAIETQSLDQTVKREELI